VIVYKLSPKYNLVTNNYTHAAADCHDEPMPTQPGFTNPPFQTCKYM